MAPGKSTVGFANPAIYAIGSSSAYTSAFHDVVTGDNTSSSSPNLFSAAAGHDLCSGWGSPSGQVLIDALALPSGNFQASFFHSPRFFL